MSSWRRIRREARLEVHVKRMTVRLVFVLGLAVTVAARGATDLPRYKFKTGQELVYSGSSDFDFGSGAFKESDTITFWVTTQNSDGSWHLLYSDRHKHARTGNGEESNDTTKFGSLDLFPRRAVAWKTRGATGRIGARSFCSASRRCRRGEGRMGILEGRGGANSLSPQDPRCRAWRTMGH